MRLNLKITAAINSAAINIFKDIKQGQFHIVRAKLKSEVILCTI